MDDFVLIECDCTPSVAAGGLHGAQRAGDEFEIRKGGRDFAEHFFVASDGEFGEILADAFDGDAEHDGEIFFVAEQDVNFADEVAVDFLRFGFAADRFPERVAEVEIVGDRRRVFAGGVHGFDSNFGGGRGKRGKDTTGVKPA